MDGAEYTQSMALLRYAGKLGGLYPEDPLAALKVNDSQDKRRRQQCTNAEREIEMETRPLACFQLCLHVLLLMDLFPAIS